MNSPRAPLLQEQEDEAQFLQKLLQVELQYMPRVDLYNDDDKALLRSIAVTLIFKLWNWVQFDVYIAYQAMTYFDRFLSRREELPELEGNKNENLKLLAIGCVSLSSKMQRQKFSLPKFLRKYRSQVRTDYIMEMELGILDALEWRMISVTALSFMDYLFPFVKSVYPQNIQRSIRQTVLKTIVGAQGDVNFTHFKPSIITATAFIKSAPACKDMILSLDYIDKGSVLMCMSAIDMGSAVKLRELMDVKYNGKGKRLDKLQGTSIETNNEEGGGGGDEGEILIATNEEKIEFISEKVQRTNMLHGGIKIHEAGSSLEKISKEREGEHGEIIVAEEVEFVNFELKWPIVEIEQELEIH